MNQPATPCRTMFATTPRKPSRVLIDTLILLPFVVSYSGTLRDRKIRIYQPTAYSAGRKLSRQMLFVLSHGRGWPSSRLLPQFLLCVRTQQIITSQLGGFASWRLCALPHQHGKNAARVGFAPRRQGAKAPRRKDAKTQRRKDAKAPRRKDTKMEGPSPYRVRGRHKADSVLP